MTFDCVIFDCSGSMAATGKTGQTRTQETLDMLYDMHRDGKINGRTLIVPFDSVVRGGITMDMLMKMSRAEVEKLFEARGGTNIPKALRYCGSINTLILTDFPDAAGIRTDHLINTIIID